ncbi:NgoMIV family type II restriction endonuclease [Trueperella pyogenes]|uniref:NgoMIV family type II restriction endonuclease n=2 Tax=Trueperella pyogenes TaxID=1661 RepID=UPI00345D352C
MRYWNMDNSNWLDEQRRRFHATLLASNTLTINPHGVPSNADKDQKSSVAFACHIAQCLEVATVEERLAGQTSGGNFENAVKAFIESTFPLLSNLRPGAWEIKNEGGKRRGGGIANYVPYVHLNGLAQAAKESPVVATLVGNAYSINPDLVVLRHPESDQTISEGGLVLTKGVADYTPLRAANQERPILHAVISCKWTMRSDRAQNARSEALNLMRNRKGRTPHILVVTGEPTPSRISSLAMGTGDVDCVYHFALPELIEAVETSGNDEALNLLHIMIEGDRLRDISDLPLDLAI